MRRLAGTVLVVLVALTFASPQAFAVDSRFVILPGMALGEASVSATLLQALERMNRAWPGLLVKRIGASRMDPQHVVWTHGSAGTGYIDAVCGLADCAVKYAGTIDPRYMTSSRIGPGKSLAQATRALGKPQEDVPYDLWWWAEFAPSNAVCWGTGLCASVKNGALGFVVVVRR